MIQKLRDQLTALDSQLYTLRETKQSLRERIAEAEDFVSEVLITEGPEADTTSTEVLIASLTRKISALPGAIEALQNKRNEKYAELENAIAKENVNKILADAQQVDPYFNQVLEAVEGLCEALRELEGYSNDCFSTLPIPGGVLNWKQLPELLRDVSNRRAKQKADEIMFTVMSKSVKTRLVDSQPDYLKSVNY